jgi:hypothetical protein
VFGCVPGSWPSDDPCFVAGYFGGERLPNDTCLVAGDGMGGGALFFPVLVVRPALTAAVLLLLASPSSVLASATRPVFAPGGGHGLSLVGGCGDGGDGGGGDGKGVRGGGGLGDGGGGDGGWGAGGRLAGAVGALGPGGGGRGLGGLGGCGGGGAGGSG